MSISVKEERTICVLLPNKEQLNITIEPKSTGQDVMNSIGVILGIKELHFFGLTVVRDNEHVFLDLEEKLVKYFSKDWRHDSGKSSQKRHLPSVLCLKVQFYVENGRLLCERKARHLYYSDLRERVLRSECRQQEEVYFQLAGYALQADLGDHPLPKEATDFTPQFKPKEYFPPWIIAKRGVDYLLCHGPKVHQELWGMSSRDAILLYIRESSQLVDVPVTFYRLQKDKKEDRGTALLGLTLRGMQVYQEVNNVLQQLYDFPWSNVGRLTFLGKKFEIQPDGLPSARKLVYYTGSSFRSRHLLLHLSSSHQLYLSLQPALKHLRQQEESKEKMRYRESYISDDLDMDPPGSESSPGLSRHSTSSSGIEADARQHSIHTDMSSIEVEGGQEEKCFGSAVSQDCSCNSEFEKSSQTQTDGEGLQEGELKADVENAKEDVVDDTAEKFHLADHQEGGSVECTKPSFKPQTAEMKEVSQESDEDAQDVCNKDEPKEVSVDWHSHSLDDVRVPPLLASLGSTMQHDTSHSCTFGLPDPSVNTKSSGDHSYYPVLNCQSKPSFYGRRSSNCLSLDVLADEQFLEFIL